MSSTSSPNCDIIIPIWNELDLTRRCLESIRSGTHWPVRLTLIDNGSEVPTRGFLEQFSKKHDGGIQLIQNAKNLGFIKAVNQGIQQSNHPWVCLLNNDTLVTEGWLTEMIRVAEQDDAIALINPSSNTLGSKPPGKDPEAIRIYAKEIARNGVGKTRELSMAVGFCMLIRRKVIDQIGLFDEQYGLGNFEDADFSKRALKEGYRCVQALGAYVYHEEKVSFKKQAQWEKAFAENQKVFYQKWGRPLRIVLEASEQPEWMQGNWSKLWIQLLQDGNWVFHQTDTDSVPTAVEQFAQWVPLAANGGSKLGLIWHVLRKKKKPIDLAIVSDPQVAQLLERMRPFHRAAVLCQPTVQQIEETCRQLSHFQS